MKTGSYTGLRFIGCLLFLLCIISMSGCVGKAEQAQETGALSGEGVGSGEETGAGQQENEEKPDITEAVQPFMYRRITAVTSIIKRCV